MRQRKLINKVSVYYGYSDLAAFLNETHFIKCQGKAKSQTILITLLKEVLIKHADVNIDEINHLYIKNYVYLDDILASGKTFKFNIKTFIEDNNLLERLKNKEIRFLSFFLCVHTWGVDNTRYSLKKLFNDDNYFLDSIKFPIHSFYDIENNIKGFNPKLNLVYPEKSKNEYDAYLVTLEAATNQSDKAYRKATQPSLETFFSSKENRKTFEQI